MICAIIEPKSDKARVERFEEGGFALAEELQIRIPRIDVSAEGDDWRLSGVPLRDPTNDHGAHVVVIDLKSTSKSDQIKFENCPSDCPYSDQIFPRSMNGTVVKACALIITKQFGLCCPPREKGRRRTASRDWARVGYMPCLLPIRVYNQYGGVFQKPTCLSQDGI